MKTLGVFKLPGDSGGEKWMRSSSPKFETARVVPELLGSPEGTVVIPGMHPKRPHGVKRTREGPRFGEHTLYLGSRYSFHAAAKSVTRAPYGDNACASIFFVMVPNRLRWAVPFHTESNSLCA